MTTLSLIVLASIALTVFKVTLSPEYASVVNTFMNSATLVIVTYVTQVTRKLDRELVEGG